MNTFHNPIALFGALILGLIFTMLAITGIRSSIRANERKHGFCNYIELNNGAFRANRRKYK